MGANLSLASTNFDYPQPGPTFGRINTRLVSRSFIHCLTQHVAEWPEYYAFIDCRPRAAYDKIHLINAEHMSSVEPVPNQLNELTIILYGATPTAKPLYQFLDSMDANGVEPATVYILDCPFNKLKGRYKVLLSNCVRSAAELPGPVELIASTKNNPAVYHLHRNQFQHCKTTVAMLGCSTVINISSRRLFLKTAAIALENIQFDSTAEPYDEAINIFMRHVDRKPTSEMHGNVLIIDETGCDYGTLLVGWYWFKNGHPLEKICELLTSKEGELDSWYPEVLRAWAESA